MGLFSKKKVKNFNVNNINEPVTNPNLKQALFDFTSNPSESKLVKVIKAIKNADFLVLAYSDGLIKTDNGNGNITIEKGSKIKFINVFDPQRNPYLAVVTDWNEVDLFLKTRENIAGWIMTPKEVFDFILMQKAYKGIFINPATDKWEMTAEQIDLFVKENY